MLKIKSVSFKNLYSYGNTIQTIIFEGKQLIIGKNRSGKSSIIEALTYGFYGKSFRPKTVLSDMINDRNKKELYVKILFSINQDEYIIERGMKPNILKLYKNSVVVDQTRIDFQEYIEEIVKIDYKSFIQLVIISKSSYVPFLRLPVPKRREFIDSFLDFEDLSKLNDINKKFLYDIEKNINKVESEIKVLLGKLEILNEINEDKKIIEQLEYTKVIDEINVSKNKIALLTSTKKNITNEDKRNNDIKTKKINNIISLLKEKLRETENKITFYTISDKCSTCQQTISIEFKEIKQINLADKKDKLIEAIKNLNNELMLISEFEEQYIKEQKINRDIEIIQNNITNLEDKLQNIKNIDHHNDDLIINIDEELIIKKQELNAFILEKDKRIYISELLSDAGIKKNIIDYYIPIINKKMNEYLNLFNVYNKFVIDSSFNIEIYSITNNRVNYYNFSDGERLRTDLSMLFVWRYLSKLRSYNDVNLLFFDEILDGSLDEEGIDSLFILFDHLSLNDYNISVITHVSDRYYDNFDSIFHVKRNEDGYSNILKKELF